MAMCLSEVTATRIVRLQRVDADGKPTSRVWINAGQVAAVEPSAAYGSASLIYLPSGGTIRVHGPAEDVARRLWGEGAAADGDELRHAIRYALTAIDEHLAGARVDWRDVKAVLQRAIEEKAGH